MARLLTDPAFLASVQKQVLGGEGLTYQLHPPTLKILGRDAKIGFRARNHVALQVLTRGKRLRGTRFDPFGCRAMRRLERRLAAHHQAMVDTLSLGLTIDNYQRATAAADAVDLVRGYEDVKPRNIDKYLQRLRAPSVDTTGIQH